MYAVAMWLDNARCLDVFYPAVPPAALSGQFLSSPADLRASLARRCPWVVAGSSQPLRATDRVKKSRRLAHRRVRVPVVCDAEQGPEV
jgi:hypothetical protein